MSDCGVIYLVLDRPIFMQMCMLSMMSLRNSGYRGQIVVITDQSSDRWQRTAELWNGDALPSYRLIPTEKLSNRKIHKTRLHRLTPFSRTLYLDCDTLVCKSIDPLWKIVAGSPIALALDRAPTIDDVRRLAPNWGNPADWDQTLALCGPEFPHYNSGVVYWESSKEAHTVFELWEREILRFCATDQSPLLRALRLADRFPMRLPPIYNRQTYQPANVSSTVILHFSGVRPDEAIDEMLTSLTSSAQQNPPRTELPSVFSRIAVRDPQI